MNEEKWKDHIESKTLVKTVPCKKPVSFVLEIIICKTISNLM